MFLPGTSLTRRAWGTRWAFALIVCTALRGQPADIAGSLPEDLFPALRPILEGAVRKNPRTLEREIEIAIEEARVLGANSNRLPRVGGELSFAHNRTAISGDSSTQSRDNGLFYRLEVNQALFHWGALKNDTERAKISVAMAEKRYAEAYRLVLLTLRQGYLDLVGKKAFLQQQRHRHKIRQAALALDQERLASGLLSPGYVEGQKLAVREHELDLERAVEVFDAARRVFARAAGIPPAELPEEAVPDEIPRPTYPAAAAATALAAMLRDGGRSSFEVQVYELEARAADLSYQIARVRLLPKVDATAGYYLENTTNATQVMVQQYGVERQMLGMVARWSIFDGLATRGAKREALATKRLSERRLANAAEEAIERAQSLGRLLKIEASAMEMAEVRRALAAESLRRQRDEVGLGNLPPTAAEEAQSQVYLSEANEALARANYLRAWTEFVSLAGIDPILNTLSARHVNEKR